MAHDARCDRTRSDRRRRFAVVLGAVVAVTALAPVASADDLRWQGGANGAWDVAANWFNTTSGATSAAVPETDTTRFEDSPTVTFPDNSTANGTQRLDVADGQNLTLRGVDTPNISDLTISNTLGEGGIRLGSGASLTIENNLFVQIFSFGTGPVLNLGDSSAIYLQGGSRLSTQFGGAPIVLDGASIDVYDAQFFTDRDLSITNTGYLYLAPDSESSFDDLSSAGQIWLNGATSFSTFTLENGGELFIGDGPTQLSLSSMLRFDAGSTTGFDLDFDEADLITTESSIAIEAGAMLNIFPDAGFAPQAGDEFLLLRALSGINGEFDVTIDGIDASLYEMVYFNDENTGEGSLSVRFLAIPEPATAAVLAGAAIVGLRRRRDVA